MKIGFTGTQVGMSDLQKSLLAGLLTRATQFHHGDCIGADAEADALVRQTLNSIKVHIHPPRNITKRAFCERNTDIVWPEKEYLDRNHDIVDMTDILIAAPQDDADEVIRSGTWSTVRYARKRGKPVIILPR